MVERLPAPEGMRWVEGAVTAPQGFRAAGVRCGIKTEGPDMGLLISAIPAKSWGLFTTNPVKAAPVIVSQSRVQRGRARGIIANSGCANCCTGPQGIADAEAMAALAAQGLGLATEEMLVASTGVIGAFLPMEKVRAGIDAAVQALSSEGGPDAARAIMTTDTVPKSSALEFSLPDGRVLRVGGIAKGVGMIEPHVATMFAFLTTDAPLPHERGASLLRLAADSTFNCLTVDGDMSTNDTVLLFSNGAAGGLALEADSKEEGLFLTALEAVCADLTRQIARDGEGATKLVEVRVSGARSTVDARRLAKAIANSNLVKTAFFGNDPNWGRILMAAGNAGVPFDANTARVTLAGYTVFELGRPAPFDAAQVSRAMAAEELTVRFEVDQGDAEVVVYTCDFSYDYVRINAEYTT